MLLIFGDAENRALADQEIPRINRKNQSYVRCWQGDRGMKTMTAAFALGAALVTCSVGTFSAAAQAKVVRQPRERLVVRVPVERPYWDSYIVPRYRYRPEDDRVDPYGPPVVPVIRYGSQEILLPAWGW